MPWPWTLPLAAALLLPVPLLAAGDEGAAPPTASAPAGLSFDGPERRGATLAATAPSPGLTIAAGGPSADTPWLISPVVRGSGGVQGLVTVHEEPRLLLRLGVGWTNVRLTRTAPPIQDGLARRWNVEGTEFAWRHDGGEWYMSVQRRNWGPGWTGSLILDGTAPPLAALGWRRPLSAVSTSPWLAWMGPWTADVFFGRLAGHDQPERPALIGFRVQMQPFDGLQLGLSRTMQWGGRGRNEDFRTLLRGIVGHDNVGTKGVTIENQPGNQLGGFDWRLQLGDEAAGAFYGQAIGEDENGYLPSAYILQAGVELRWAVDGAALLGFAEWNDLIAGDAYGGGRPPGITYTSAAYLRGYTHDRMPLGHPAGGDVKLASVGLMAQSASLRMAAVVSQGDALASSTRFAAGPIEGLNASLQWEISKSQQAGAGLWWWRDTAAVQRALQLWWRVGF